jgi:cytochrome c oxidase subunit II
VPFRGAFGQLFVLNNSIAFVVFGLVMAGLLVAIAGSRSRKRRGLAAFQVDEANRVELGYVAALIGIAIFLVAVGFAANAKDFPDPPKPAVRVQVVGYQWCWRFRYEGTSTASVGQCQGTEEQLPVLVVPAGEPVRLDITSADVVHAVWVPQWRFKLYAYPDITQSLTVTIPQTGRWIGRCAQLCGLYHYEMDFWLQAVSPATFKTFLRTGITP